jgi:hypothetical protein
MPGINNHRHTGKAPGDHAIVMNQVIVGMQNIWPIEP